MEEIKHINKKNQEYIAEGNRMTEEMKTMDKEFIENPVIAYEKLKEENAELKQEVETWKYQTEKSDKLADEDFAKAQKYRKALEEIRGIADVRFVDGLNEEAEIYNQDMDRIRNKINEVLND